MSTAGIRLAPGCKHIEPLTLRTADRMWMARNTVPVCPTVAVGKVRVSDASARTGC